MLSISGKFTVKIIREGRVAFEQSFSNGIVDEGKTALLETTFKAGTQSTWYCGLIDTITTLSNADTMASHAGWTEFADYTGGVRLAWGPDTAADKSITNTTIVEFTASDSGTVDGVFITSDNTISGTTGVLWSTAAYDTPPTVVASDKIQVIYTVTIN